MSKAVLISIRPKWCEKIINGDKTIEVRKTRRSACLSFGQNGFAIVSPASSGAGNAAIVISARRKAGAMWRR